MFNENAVVNSDNRLCDAVEVVRYYAETYSHYDMDHHTHKEAEFMYCVFGSCDIFISHNNKEQHIKLREQEYIYVSPEINHRLYVSPGSKCRILNLEIDTAANDNFSFESFMNSTPAYRRYISSIGSYALYKDRNGSMHGAIAALHSLLLEKGHCAADDRSFEIALNIGHIFLMAARHGLQSNSAKPGETRHVRRAMAYIDSGYDEGINVSDIAAYAGVSAGYLQRCFKAETGKSLIEYINSRRLEKAKHLLLTSNLLIDDIAAECGYGSRQSFSSAFTADSGISPGVFRKTYASSKGDRLNIRVYG